MVRFTILGIVIAVGLGCASTKGGPGERDAGVPPADAADTADAIPIRPTARGAFCGAGGRMTSGDFRLTVCAGAVEVVTEHGEVGDIEWRPGPIHIIEPSGGRR